MDTGGENTVNWGLAGDAKDAGDAEDAEDAPRGLSRKPPWTPKAFWVKERSSEG